MAAMSAVSAATALATPGASGLAASSAAGVGVRQLEALEAKLLSMVAAHLREADKLTVLAGKNVEARLGALEHRQGELERDFSEFAVASTTSLEGAAKCSGFTGSNESSSRRGSGGIRERAAMPGGDDEELRQLREAERHAEELERRLEDTGKLEAERSAPRRTAAASRRIERGGGGGEACGMGGAEFSTQDTALIAVQELEVLLQEELKAVHRRCMGVQDSIDERVLLPLRDFEQRLQEQDHKVQQLVGAGQDCSSRLEEHEFRLGVARTKLEMHDQKISRLEAMRWQRSGSGCAGTEPSSGELRERSGSGLLSASPTASPSPLSGLSSPAGAKAVSGSGSSWFPHDDASRRPTAVLS